MPPDASDFPGGIPADGNIQGALKNSGEDSGILEGGGGVTGSIVEKAGP